MGIRRWDLLYVNGAISITLQGTLRNDPTYVRMPIGNPPDAITFNMHITQSPGLIPVKPSNSPTAHGKRVSLLSSKGS
jgi:hypothetical protein